MSAAAKPTAFDGEMAVLYQSRFDQHHHKDGPWAMMLKEVKAALPSGTGAVLDLASGPGEPGAMVAKALPGAHVTLSDYSGDMVEKARAHVAGLGNATVVQADAFNMTGMPSDHFDVVTCCYGYMFCPPEHRLKTFTETFRVLKPGGTLVATYWVQLEFTELVRATMTAALGATPPPPDINPLSLREPGLVEGLMHKEGFVDARYSESTYPMELMGDADHVFNLGTLTVRDKLRALQASGKGDAVDAGRAAFWGEVDRRGLRVHGGVRVNGNTFRMLAATKPM
ncbi:hypothetical protein FOA52_009750 [Chlamydomonas sp. UWO 241]|nr:hypothetical protein FOA52_009750 [Chlamydomonas sp. UWO 241]